MNPDHRRFAHVQENLVRPVPPLRGFVLGLLPLPHLVADIVQETFLTAREKAETFERFPEAKVRSTKFLA